MRKPHWPSLARRIKAEAKEITSSGKGDFQIIQKKAQDIEDPYYRSQALIWIGRAVKEAGQDPTPLALSAIRCSGDVVQEWRRAELIVFLAREMKKSGSLDVKEILYALNTLKDPGLKTRTYSTLQGRLKKWGVESSMSLEPTPSPNNSRPPKDGAARIEPALLGKEEGMMSGITLGLVNTYVGKTLKDPHIRAVGRSAPLCAAYDLNLGLIGFPVKTVSELILHFEEDSAINRGRDYLKTLASEGRLVLHEYHSKSMEQMLGTVVATTSSPDPVKEVSLDELLTLERVGFLVGLGSKGLPKKVLDRSEYHFELTGRKISLETCTAIGALAALLGRNR